MKLVHVYQMSKWTKMYLFVKKKNRISLHKYF